MADVAKQAGVSSTTASLVLSGRGRELRISQAVEQRVLEAAEQLEYRRNIVSVGLRTGTTRTIGFVSDTVATSRLAGDMIKGALEAARERGVMLFIGETEGETDLERGLLQAMHDRRVDGIVFASMFTRTLKVPPALTTGPAVLLNAVSKVAELPSVVPDEVEAGRAAARILLDAGHCDGIHAIGGGPRVRDVKPDALAGVERLTGIREVLAEAKVKLAGGHVTPDWLPEYGYEATRELLDRGERPRALICLNDRLALGAYQALDDYALKVPTDVSVVSFDDHPIAGWIRPKLTTVALPHYELGRKAVDVLFDVIERHRVGEIPAGETHRVPMPVRLRDSVAPPGA